MWNVDRRAPGTVDAPKSLQYGRVRTMLADTAPRAAPGGETDDIATERLDAGPKPRA